MLSFRSISLPVILVLTIETAIWINLSIPYYSGKPLFYIAYLIISSIQLGATVDYAILFTDRYREEKRECLGKKGEYCRDDCRRDSLILTSGTVLTVVGFLLGYHINAWTFVTAWLSAWERNHLLSNCSVFLYCRDFYM